MGERNKNIRKEIDQSIQNPLKGKSLFSETINNIYKFLTSLRKKREKAEVSKVKIKVKIPEQTSQMNQVIRNYCEYLYD